MKTKNEKKNSKVAIVFLNNEIVLSAVKKALEKRNYTVRQDMDSCLDARFGIIGSYFAHLGVIKQMRAINSTLPVIMIENSEFKANGFSKDAYDVISIDDKCVESDISRKIENWFSNGQGKILAKGA